MLHVDSNVWTNSNNTIVIAFIFNNNIFSNIDIHVQNYKLNLGRLAPLRGGKKKISRIYKKSFYIMRVHIVHING